MPERINVLFVCMGNICRSPTAEGVFRDVVRGSDLHDRIAIDSAGTIDFHRGEEPDPRAQETALKHGIDLSALRARQVSQADFARFEYVVAMDEENMAALRARCPEKYASRLSLLCTFAADRTETEVPDPYYGGPGGFEDVFELVRAASEGLLDTIVRVHFADHAR